MSILLRIESETAKDLREKLLVLLGIAEHPLVFQHADEPLRGIHDDDGKEHGPNVAANTAADAPLTPAGEAAVRKLRGRPRKAEPNTDAPVPTVPQHKAAEDTTTAAPPTMADVTPTEYAKSAPAALETLKNQPVTMFDAPTQQTQPAATTEVTFEQVKEALQKVAAVRPTDTNEMAGLNRATLIIGKVQIGCKKIKEIKPENYAAVLIACSSA